MRVAARDPDESERSERSRRARFVAVAGRAAPEGKRMGHAGAIVTRGMGTAQSKMDAFRKAGVEVADFPTDIADLVHKRGIR